jgi:hypothetical protein
VVSQDLVVFTTAGPSKIVLKAPQMEFRGVQGSSVKKSYADSTLWSADVGTVQCVLNLYLFLFLRVSFCVVLCRVLLQIVPILWVMSLSSQCGRKGTSL